MWLKSIKIVKAEDSHNARQIGYCHAKLIDRDRIRGTFYRNMEEPTNDLSELAFSLFDRWGNLKSELRNHTIKKAQVWGEELDEGKFLLIEEFTIDENHRRKGYGRKLVGARFGFVTSQPAYSRLLGHVFGTNLALNSILRLVSYSRDLCSDK